MNDPSPGPFAGKINGGFKGFLLDFIHLDILLFPAPLQAIDCVSAAYAGKGSQFHSGVRIP